MSIKDNNLQETHYMEIIMHLDLTSLQNWLTCRYPQSSARKHIISDLTLFFSWAGKPPSEISPQDVKGIKT